MKIKKDKKPGTGGNPVWVDWLILLLAFTAIVLTGGYIRQRRRAVLPSTAITYTVLTSGVDASLASSGDWKELIPIGSRVLSQNGTARLGNVTAVSSQPHLCATVRSGEVVFVPMPDRVDLLVTVRADATVKTGDGLRVSDIRIAAGEVGDFRLAGFLASGAKVISVERNDGA